MVLLEKGFFSITGYWGESNLSFSHGWSRSGRATSRPAIKDYFTTPLTSKTILHHQKNLDFKLDTMFDGTYVLFPLVRELLCFVYRKENKPHI